MKLNPGAFCGQRHYLTKLDGLCFSEYTYAPAQQIPEHCHASSYLSVPLQGAYTETRGPSETYCEEGTALFHPAEESHRDCFEKTGGRLFSIELDGRWVGRLHEESVPVTDGFMLGGRVFGLATRLAAVVRQTSCNRLYAEGLALELLGLLPRSRSLTHERSEPGWLKFIEEVLHEHASEPITLGAICDDIGIHSSHVGRTFKRFRGCSMTQYIRQLRIQQAKKRLLHSRQSLAEVAALLGFSDQSHFSRVFKRETGMTPKQFQKNTMPKTC